MEHILPYSYSFGTHDRKVTGLVRWGATHPGTNVKFADINDTDVFKIIIYGNEYLYDCSAKTLRKTTNVEHQLTYNNVNIAESSMEEVLDEFDKIGKQSNHLNRAPISNAPTVSNALASLSSDPLTDEFTKIDPDTVNFEVQLQNLRKSKKGITVFYTMDETVATLNFGITNVEYSFSFQYDISKKTFSNLVFNTPMPETLLVWLINREWLKKSQSLVLVSAWLIDNISTAEPHINHKFDFTTESLSLFEIHNIGIEEYEWTDEENVCFNEKHSQHDTIVELLTSIYDKLIVNKKNVESAHINGIYPIINYYLATKQAGCVFCNPNIYTLIAKIVKIITETYRLEISQTVKNSLLTLIASSNDEDILGGEHKEVIKAIIDL